MTEFMGKIQPLVFNLAKGAGNTSPGCDFKAVTPGQMPQFSQFPLYFSQMLFGLSKQPGVSHLLTTTKISEVLKSHVYANYRAFMNGWLKLIFNREAYKPVAQPVPANSTSFNFTQYLPMKVQADSTNLRNGQEIVLYRPAALGKSEAIIAITALKTGKASFHPTFYPAKESLESFIYPPERVLQYLRMHFFEVGPDLFNSGKLARLVVVVKAFTNHAVSIPAFLQSGVIELPAQPECSFQPGNLGFGWEYSKFVGFAGFHGLLTFLAFDVFLDGFDGYAPGRDYEIRICPQTRQTAFKVGKLFTELVGTCPLDELNQPMNTELRVTTNQQVNMVRHDFHFNELLSPFFNYLKNDSFKTLIYWWGKHTTPVFRAKHHVIPARIGNTVVGFNLCIHTKIIPLLLDMCKQSIGLLATQVRSRLHLLRVGRIPVGGCLSPMLTQGVLRDLG